MAQHNSLIIDPNDPRQLLGHDHEIQNLALQRTLTLEETPESE